MSEDACIFCQIVQGNIPCHRLLETENCIAFLDIAPVQPGHTLVIPKAHMASVFDVSINLGAELFAVQQQVGKALLQGIGADGLNVFQNNFSAAGQVVPHVHWHLIPRMHGDNLTLWPQGSYSSSGAVHELMEKIKTHL